MFALRTTIRYFAGNRHSDTILRPGARQFGTGRLRQRRAKAGRTATTLQPERLSLDDVQDLSSALAPRLNASGSLCYQITQHNSTRRVPFPPGTQGWLYHHPGKAPSILSGEVRFRIVGADGSFTAGRDLELPEEGGPWHVPLLSIASSKCSHLPLAKLLVSDGIFPSEEYVLKLRDDPLTTVIRTSTSTVIHRENNDHTFPIQLHHQNTRLHIVDSSIPVARLVALPNLFNTSPQKTTSKRALIPRVTPLTGTLICQFELSMLPEHAGTRTRGTRTFVIRVLEILEPIHHHRPDLLDKVPIPEQGQLLRVYRRGALRPWSYEVDTNKPVQDLENLRLLLRR